MPVATANLGQQIASTEGSARGDHCAGSQGFDESLNGVKPFTGSNPRHHGRRLGCMNR